MRVAWSAKFPRSSLRAAMRLRLVHGVELCDAGESLWMRAGGAFEDVDPLLRCIPDVIRYTVADDGMCTRVGHRIPDCPLPTGPFTTPRHKVDLAMWTSTGIGTSSIRFRSAIPTFSRSMRSHKGPIFGPRRNGKSSTARFRWRCVSVRSRSSTVSASHRQSVRNLRGSPDHFLKNETPTVHHRWASCFGFFDNPYRRISVPTFEHPAS
jgi:hypothetical protein